MIRRWHSKYRPQLSYLTTLLKQFNHMQTTFPSHKQLSKDAWIGVQTNVGLVCRPAPSINISIEDPTRQPDLRQ